MSCGTLVILKMTTHSMRTSITHWAIAFRLRDIDDACLCRSFSPTPKRSFTKLLANPEFNTCNLVLALIGETSFALFLRITETLADYNRKIPIEEKNPISPPTAAACRLRLIVSSTNSNEEKRSQKARTYLYLPRPAGLPPSRHPR